MRGETKNDSTIWIDNSHGSNSILFSFGSKINSDNSHNDWAYVENDDYEMFLSLGNLGFILENESQKKASPEKAAEYFWKRFTLNR